MPNRTFKEALPCLVPGLFQTPWAPCWVSVPQTGTLEIQCWKTLEETNSWRLMAVRKLPISLLDPETRNLRFLHLFLMSLSASFLGRTWLSNA